MIPETLCACPRVLHAPSVLASISGDIIHVEDQDVRQKSQDSTMVERRDKIDSPAELSGLLGYESIKQLRRVSAWRPQQHRNRDRALGSGG